MRRSWGVGVVLLLLLVAAPRAVFAQQSPNRGSGVQLKGNYPNPFNPTTTIPLVLTEEAFEGGKSPVVSIKIYNVLQQLVAVPTALNHPAGNGTPVDNLQYTEPGEKLAFWDGTDRSGRKVASGVYYYQVVVNGVRYPPRKMVVTK